MPYLTQRMMLRVAKAVRLKMDDDDDIVIERRGGRSTTNEHICIKVYLSDDQIARTDCTFSPDRMCGLSSEELKLKLIHYVEMCYISAKELSTYPHYKYKKTFSFHTSDLFLYDEVDSNGKAVVLNNNGETLEEIKTKTTKRWKIMFATNC